jgi:hypothetical protein
MSRRNNNHEWIVESHFRMLICSIQLVCRRDRGGDCGNILPFFGDGEVCLLDCSRLCLVLDCVRLWHLDLLFRDGVVNLRPGPIVPLGLLWRIRSRTFLWG